MEAGRSFSSLFPVSQSQVTLQRSQRAVMMQQQIREKEEQLQDQLALIRRRQQDAHKRNQDLLHHFKRIEDKLSLLATRTDSFRRKREIYKKQMYAFLSAESKCVAPEITKSSTGPSYNKSINVPLGTNDGRLGEGEHFHFVTSAGNVIHPPARFSLCPTQPLILQGCCSHLPYYLANPHCKAQFGNSMPDASKALFDCTQKKNITAKYPLLHKNDTYDVCTKGATLWHGPGCLPENDSPKCRTSPTQAYGETLPCRCSLERCSEGEGKTIRNKQQNNSDQTAAQTRKEEDSSKSSVHRAATSISASEYLQHSLVANSKTHLSSGSASSKEDKDYKTSLQNLKDQTDCKEQIVDDKNREGNDGVRCSSASDSLESKEEKNMYETEEKRDAIQCGLEMQTSDSSSEESINDQAASNREPKNVANPVQLKGISVGNAAAVFKKSYEEVPNSDEEDNVMKCINNEHEEEDTSVSSDLSMEGKGSPVSSSTHSISEKEQEMRPPSPHRVIIKHNQDGSASSDCIIHTDKMKEILDMDISDEESEASIVRQSQSRNQSQKIVTGSGIKRTPEEDCKLAGVNTAENKNGDKEEGVEDGEKLQSTAEKVSSCEEESESEENSESRSPKKVSMITVKGDESDGINEENDNENEEDSGEDSKNVDENEENSGEDNISDDEDDYEGSCASDGSDLIKSTKEEGDNNGDDINVTNLGSEILSGDETSHKSDVSENQRSLSEDPDVSDDSLEEEEEENTDFWGSKHDGNDSDLEVIEKVEHEIPSKENQDVSARKEESDHQQHQQETVVEKATVNTQDLMEVEEDPEKRFAWFCCLKTCSGLQMCSKSNGDQEMLGKRFSEDVAMDLLQMHPVELGSSLPVAETPQKTPDSPIPILNSRAASNCETEASSEDSALSDNDNESQKPPWSESEDDDHFYD